MIIQKRLDYLIGPLAVFAFLLLLSEHSAYFAPHVALVRKLNVAVLLLFVLDVLLEFALSPDKAAYLKRYWPNLIVFVPLAQLVHGIGNRPLFVVLLQIVVVVRLVSRARRPHRFLTLLGLKPAQLIVSSYALAISVGAVLLTLPAAVTGGTPASLADAWFTATSATCVTGLIVQDTGTYFSLFGQSVILGLMQVGALGIMTFSVMLTVFMRRGLEIRQQVVLRDMLDQDTFSDAKRLVLFIVKMTFVLEAVGVAALFVAWNGRFESHAATAYQALFHSVSAFCNAGFSLLSDNLVRFADDPFTNGILAALIISGGLGFLVISDLQRAAARKLSGRGRPAVRLRIQTKIVLAVSAILIVLGTAVIFAVERNGASGFNPLRTQLLVAFFQSVTARTAGFNTCDISALSGTTLLAIIVLMFIGASPGSTGGGIKTTTVSVLWATIVSALRQKENVEIHRRTIPQETVKRAATLLVTSMTVVVVVAGLLLYTEKGPFAGLLFETVSAFGTVGLSTGVTPTLSTAGKALLSFMMILGRVGPLTLAYVFTVYRSPRRYTYPEERVMIG